VALEDAQQVRAGFVFFRTTHRSLAELVERYAWDRVGELPSWPGARDWLCRRVGGDDPDGFGLLIRTPRDRLFGQAPLSITAYDRRLRPRLEFAPADGVDDPAGVRYVEWAGAEYLAAGLRLTRAWATDGTALDLPAEPILLSPRFDPI
jgi:hypothetical protein